MKGPIDIVMRLVLLGVCLLVLIGVTVVLFDLWYVAEEDLDCSSQIRAHAAVVKLTAEQKQLNIKCPTKRFPLVEEHEKWLARHMRQCWDMWGNGELQLFGTNDGMYCHVCSVHTIENIPKMENFHIFLQNTTMEGATVTYEEYLSGTLRGSHFAKEDIPANAEAEFLAEDPVGVIFYHAKGQSGMEKLWNHFIPDPVTGTAVGAGLGGAAGGVAFAKFGAVFVGIVAAPAWVPSAAATGIAAGTAIGTGVVLGGGAGLTSSILLRAELDTASVVVARSLSEETVKKLGCTYAPVSN
ncbi:MAG: hypothetical protein OXR66_06055 [Candidatus Woesearchaeota archaeon]|nr:hypothetical protein [Candidatus Woesearchaeota archaeon]